jgi:hypothetical protein
VGNGGEPSLFVHTPIICNSALSHWLDVDEVGSSNLLEWRSDFRILFRCVRPVRLSIVYACQHYSAQIPDVRRSVKRLAV